MKAVVPRALLGAFQLPPNLRLPEGEEGGEEGDGELAAHLGRSLVVVDPPATEGDDNGETLGSELGGCACLVLPPSAAGSGASTGGAVALPPSSSSASSGVVDGAEGAEQRDEGKEEEGDATEVVAGGGGGPVGECRMGFRLGTRRLTPVGPRATEETHGASRNQT